MHAKFTLSCKSLIVTVTQHSERRASPYCATTPVNQQQILSQLRHASLDALIARDCARSASCQVQLRSRLHTGLCCGHAASKHSLLQNLATLQRPHTHFTPPTSCLSLMPAMLLQLSYAQHQAPASCVTTLLSSAMKDPGRPAAAGACRAAASCCSTAAASTVWFSLCDVWSSEPSQGKDNNTQSRNQSNVVRQSPHWQCSNQTERTSC